MCSVKTPKPVAAQAATDKPLQVLRNPYLDGIDPIIRAQKSGTRSLRIDRGAPRVPAGAGAIARPTLPQTAPPASAAVDPRLEVLSKLPGPFGLMGKFALRGKT